MSVPLQHVYPYETKTPSGFMVTIDHRGGGYFLILYKKHVVGQALSKGDLPRALEWADEDLQVNSGAIDYLEDYDER